MSSFMEVPRLADLSELPVEVMELEEPGVVRVTCWADDGSVVILTWDEMVRSVHVRWVEGDNERLILERETASKVSVRFSEGRIEFRVWFDAGSSGGQLVVRVGTQVSVSDTLLRK